MSPNTCILGSDKKDKYLINVGRKGHPLLGCPDQTRSCAKFNLKKKEEQRVAYYVDEPARLIIRLLFGFASDVFVKLKRNISKYLSH